MIATHCDGSAMHAASQSAAPYVACVSVITLCLKKMNFETVLLKIIRINFDEIWQKYSKDSRIEFVCFSFHVALLF